MITPPTSPTSPTSSSKASSSYADQGKLPTSHEGSIIMFPPNLASNLELRKDDIIGRGMSSDVYRVAVPAELLSASASSVTPPSSPASAAFASANGEQSVYAVKVPATKWTKRLINHEARVLSELQHHSEYQRHIVGFYGLANPTGALVMEYIPQSLDRFINQGLNLRPRAARAAAVSSSYQVLASQLTRALAFIQTHGFVHGDIKPANVLLRADSTPSSSSSSEGSAFPYTAVLADFTSARHLADPKPPDAGGTTDFLSPQLLSSRGGRAHGPEPDDDAWALGVTLLVYVAGASPYRRGAAALDGMVRLTWVKSGDPLGWVMRDEELAQRFGDVEGKQQDGGEGAGALSAWFERRFRDGMAAWVDGAADGGC